MEENQKKNVERALTTDEIRLQASKWTLAGDVGLLAHLEQFSQNLLSKSQETQNNINALYDAFEDASTTINNVTNQFLALQNSQFVENRVYDDESPNEEQKSDEKISKEEQEKLLLAQYKEAVEIGIKLLDSHFEEVQLPPNSDSDEEEVAVENSGLVWKPKNPYASKRFPLLIGSAEWWADDNVGLGEYEENVNPDTLSSESESDMEAEDAADKRIRMSSSSSSESERILSKKPKEQSNSDYDDIFTPVGKDRISDPSNLFDEDNSKIVKTPTTYGTEEKAKPLDFTGEIENAGELGKSYSSKQQKSNLFDDNEDGNIEEEYGSEPKASVTIPNKITNAFTKELASKLSSVVSKHANEHLKPENKEQSALFDENDDNDDLFSAKNSASTVLLKKQSLFADVDNDDQLFGDSENLFSGSNKGPTPKKSVKISTPSESNNVVPKESKSSNLFDKPDKFLEDDLFGGNDDFLFSGKSGLGSSLNSGGPGTGWKNSGEVKFSTPTERDEREVPGADIFGGVSEIRSNSSSNIESVSALNNNIDNSFNFSRLSNADASKDYGFVEPSDVSNNKSGKVGSPELFDPLLTSTRQIVSDTSDYKTHGTSSSQISQTKSSSIMSQFQDNQSSKMGHSENAHFSRQQSETNKGKGLFDEDEDDDLFQTNKSSKPVRENSLFDDTESDDLFSSIVPKKEKSHPVLVEKGNNSAGRQKSSLPPVEDDEEDKHSLTDKLKQDSVSMSSSRSSLFDDANVGKTNLASVFDNDKSMKNSNSLFGKTDDDIFGENRTKNFDDRDAGDLFGDNPVLQTTTKISTSLFDDLEDVDDLFGSQKIFVSRVDDADLFGKPEKYDKEKKNNNASAEKIFDDNEEEEDDTVGSKASLGHNTESASSTSDNKSKGKDIFDGSNKVDTNLRFSNEEKSLFEDKPKPKSSAIGSLFGELEDEDEDLFSNNKGKENKNSCVKSEKIDEGTKYGGIPSSKNCLQEKDDDIFKAETPKEKINESVRFTTPEGTVTGIFDESLVTGISRLDSKIGKNVGVDDGSQEKLNISNSNINNSNSNDISNNMFSGKEDLFDNGTSKSSSLFENSESRSLTENKVDEMSDSNLFSTKPLEEVKSPDEKAENGARPSPPKSLNIIKRLDLTNKQDNNRSETDGLAMSSEKAKVIGKLNIPAGLKINPMSLLPGAAMKKNVPVENPSQKEEVCEPQKSGVLDKPSEPAPNLLKCLSKDRVKIQTRRRPQTRRARHEALRSSGIDFEVSTEEVASVTARSRSVDDFEKGLILPSTIKSSSDTNVNDPLLVNSVDEKDKVLENADSSNSIFHSFENSPEGLFSSPLVLNPLSPSTDEEDYFNVPELDVNFEREDQSIFKSNLNDFKNADKSDDNLLFDGAPVLSPMNPGVGLMPSPKKEPESQVKALAKEANGPSEKSIDSSPRIIVDDDEDSLFESSDAKRSGNAGEKKAEIVSKTSNIFDDLDEGDSFLFKKKSISILGAKEVPKKTLFEDNDEDDDLFGDRSVASNSLSKTANESASKNRVNKCNIAEKSKEPFVDPLGLMTNPD